MCDIAFELGQREYKFSKIKVIFSTHVINYLKVHHSIITGLFDILCNESMAFGCQFLSDLAFEVRYAITRERCRD